MSIFLLTKLSANILSFSLKNLKTELKTAKNLSRQFRFNNYLTSVCIINLSKTSSFSLHSFLNRRLCKACCFILLTALITKFSELFKSVVFKVMETYAH